jgi:hypothetical protein
MRLGMWVRVNSKTGIVTNLDPLTVDLVDDKGETVETVQPSSAKQAKRSEIPAARRPKADHAKRLGYA